jgi:CheY-like chemotaxis protein
LVHDQGIGIPKDQLMKIFDPYYTTKPGGSGLGLATVYSIIKQHDGFITVESSPGAGTSIIFYLPASDQEVVLEKAPRAELITGQGRILVMDDEEMVRVVAGKMLTHLGYEVALAGDGAQALELYRLSMEEGQPFAAVIMDLTVPAGMGGKETMRKLLDLDPQARAIVSSGYAADPIMTHYKTFGFQGCIRKPYKIDNLSLLLARVLQPEG